MMHRAPHSSGGPIVDTAHVLGGQRKRDPPVRDALARALQALNQNDGDAALATFEYAQRLAPSDLAITVAIGDLRFALGDPTAVDAFALVAARTDWREAWICLARVRQRFAEPALAAADLNHALTRSAPSRSAAFRSLAGEIAHASGAPGWCGLDSTGCLTLGGAIRQFAASDIVIAIDGAAIRLHRLTRSRDALVHRFRIRDAWRAGSRLTVHADGNPVIGSPIEIQQITRIEGFVREEDGGISGWCWLPGDRDVNPKIVVSSVANALHRMTLRAEQPATEDGPFADFAAPRQFAVTAQDIAAFGGPVVVSGPYGKPLFGSPLNPMGEAESAAAAAARAIARQFPASPAPDGPAVDAIREICIPTGLPGPRPRHPNPEEADRPVIVVIPVHRGLDVTLACLDSVLAARSGPEKVLVIADAPPDHVLVTRLQQLAAAGAFQLDMRPVTKGFPATANVGLRRAATQGCDAVLLNSDTLVAPGWMAALRHAVYGHNTDIGTATPLSNAATIFSYPDARAANPIPNPQDTARFASLAREVNGSAIVDVPTGHGFCLYVRLECLLDIGLLREDAFAQGYGEENDFCMRARHLGWRHVAATGTFVGHAEGQSFGAARTRPHTTAHSIGRVIASGAEYLRGPEFWPRYGGHSDVSGTNARMRGSTMVLLTRRPSIPSIIRDQTRGIAYAAHDPPGSQAGTDTGHADPTA